MTFEQNADERVGALAGECAVTRPGGAAFLFPIAEHSIDCRLIFTLSAAQRRQRDASIYGSSDTRTRRPMAARAASMSFMLDARPGSSSLRT